MPACCAEVTLASSIAGDLTLRDACHLFLTIFDILKLYICCPRMTSWLTLPSGCVVMWLNNDCTCVFVSVSIPPCPNPCFFVCNTLSLSISPPRSHCRVCGDLVCRACCTAAVRLKELPAWGLVAACDFCFYGQVTVTADRQH